MITVSFIMYIEVAVVVLKVIMHSMYWELALLGSGYSHNLVILAAISLMVLVG